MLLHASLQEARHAAINAVPEMASEYSIQQGRQAETIGAYNKNATNIQKLPA